VYTLQVFYPGDSTVRQTVRVDRAADVLTIIPELLEQHDGCERIVVLLDAVRLFAVDCQGNRILD